MPLPKLLKIKHYRDVERFGIGHVRTYSGKQKQNTQRAEEERGRTRSGLTADFSAKSTLVMTKIVRFPAKVKTYNNTVMAQHSPCSKYTVLHRTHDTSVPGCTPTT